MDGDQRDAFIRQMMELDPIERVRQLSPAPIMFQFGRDDPHIPLDRAEAFITAAQEPVDVRWYETGHELNDEARQARITWLSQRLAV